MKTINPSASDKIRQGEKRKMSRVALFYGTGITVAAFIAIMLYLVQ